LPDIPTLTIAPRVISLDLDDTLWPVAPVIAAAEKTLFAWLQARCPQAVHGHSIDSMRAMRARVAADFPDQSHDLTFLRHRALAAQFAQAGYSESLVDEAMEVFLVERNRVEFYSDVRPALTRLRASYRLFAVSNGNADLQRCGLGDLFDGHVTAISAGAAKPDARIFAALQRMAGVSPMEVMHIGDDPFADVGGATQAGMQAVWLNRESRPWPREIAPPARTISTLAQIF
jgi:FMN hydrolase / 5-amino-6-(5-phospho-D-ribitylamino)uracil phosphatase